MADTQFGTNDPNTRKKWSDALFDYALDMFWFFKAGLIGIDQNAIIQVLKELDPKNEKGDTINYRLKVPLSGEGVDSDGTITGSEEAITYLNDKATLGGFKNACKIKGPLNEKRMVEDFRTASKDSLGEWLPNMRLEPDIVRALCGIYNASGLLTVNEVEPSTNRKLFLGQNASGVVSTYATDALLSAATVTDALCGLQVLRRVSLKARMATPKIRPISIPGVSRKVFPVLLNSYAMMSLRASVATGELIDLSKGAYARDKSNPMLSLAEFLFEDLLIFDYERLPIRTGADGVTPAEGFLLNAGRTETTDPVADGKSVGRNLLLGKQSAVMMWGQKPQWEEDNAGEPGVKRIATYGLYAMKKVQFNTYTQPSGPNAAQEDYGVIAFDTQVVVV